MKKVAHENLKDALVPYFIRELTSQGRMRFSVVPVVSARSARGLAGRGPLRLVLGIGRARSHRPGSAQARSAPSPTASAYTSYDFFTVRDIIIMSLQLSIAEHRLPL